MRIARHLVLVIMGLLVGVSSYSQHWLGLSSSNYAGTNALYLNPAHAADSRHKLYINLIGNDFFLINNYLRFDAPYSFLGLITNTVPKKYRSERGLIIWRESYYAERLNGKPKHLHTGGDLRGPSFLYSFNNNRFAIGLTSRGRYSLNATNVSEETARVIRYGTKFVELQEKLFTNQSALVSINGLIELGATFGAVIKDENEYFLKVGGTVKRLVGVYNLHTDLKNTNYEVLVDDLNPNQQFILARQLEILYGYTSEGAYSNISPSPSFLFGNKSAGGGWGLDLGIVYEFRPDYRKFKSYIPRRGRESDFHNNKYKIRISAALNDVGAVRYRNPNYIREVAVDTTTLNLTARDFGNIKGTEGLFVAINRNLNVRPADNPRPFTVGLPTSANVSVDYHIQDNWYVNGLWVQGLRGSNNLHIKTQSVLAVTPRYETRWFEVATPLAMIDNYRVFTVGLAARVGPLVLGTDHLGGLLDIGKPQGLDFYFSLNVPILYSKPKEVTQCFDPSPKKRLFKKNK